MEISTIEQKAPVDEPGSPVGKKGKDIISIIAKGCGAEDKKERRSLSGSYANRSSERKRKIIRDSSRRPKRREEDLRDATEEKTNFRARRKEPTSNGCFGSTIIRKLRNTRKNLWNKRKSLGKKE